MDLIGLNGYYSFIAMVLNVSRFRFRRATCPR